MGGIVRFVAVRSGHVRHAVCNGSGNHCCHVFSLRLCSSKQTWYSKFCNVLPSHNVYCVLLAVNWGSSGQAHVYKNALHSMLALVYSQDHVKNYRPSIMLLSGNPVIRPCLVNFVANITKDTSLFICGDVLLVSMVANFPRQCVISVIFQHNDVDELSDALKKRGKKIQYFLKKRKIKTFYCPFVAPTFASGCKSMLQLAGFGKFRPNIIFMGFKRNWKQSSAVEIEEYFNLIQ